LGAVGGASASLEDSLLENVKGFNRALQEVQVEQLKRNYKNVEDGVKAKAAF